MSLVDSVKLLIPHFILFPLVAFPSAGGFELVLPDGMQSVNFQECSMLTGTAERET